MMERLDELIRSTGDITITNRWYGFEAAESFMLSELDDPFRSYGLCDRASQKWIIECMSLDPSFAMAECRIVNTMGFGHSAATVILDGFPPTVVDWTIHQFAHPFWGSQEVDLRHPWVTNERTWRMEVERRLSLRPSRDR